MPLSALYGPAFTVDGLALNGGTDSFGCDWTLTEQTGWFDTPPIKASRGDRPASRGVSVGPEYKGARVVTFGGELNAPTVATLRVAQRRLGGICQVPDKLYSLVAVEEDGTTLTAAVKLDGAILTAPKAWNTVTWSIQLMAPDPRKFGLATAVSTQLAGAGGGGIQWQGPAGATGIQWQGPTPGTTGTQWGLLGNSGTATLDNSAGTAPADVVATITTNEDLLGAALVNAITGETVSYGPTIHAGDTLIFNCATGAVLLNGTNQRPNLARAEFFEVAAGTALPVRFQASAPAPSALMSVAFGPAYY